MVASTLWNMVLMLTIPSLLVLGLTGLINALATWRRRLRQQRHLHAFQTGPQVGDWVRLTNGTLGRVSGVEAPAEGRAAIYCVRTLRHPIQWWVAAYLRPTTPTEEEYAAWLIHDLSR